MSEDKKQSNPKNTENQGNTGDKEDISSKIPKIDVTNYFNYQKALNSLIDYLNNSIEDLLSRMERKDQLIFDHSQNKLMLNTILENGFYQYCKFIFEGILQVDPGEKDKFLEVINIVHGEMDLLAWLLIQTRLVHSPISFDVFLSLLAGGLYEDIMLMHAEILVKMSKMDTTGGKVDKSDGKSENRFNKFDEHVKTGDNRFYI